jgi:hypothetical protein
MGELGISAEGSCQHGVGGALSCPMALLWLIGEASNAKDFAPQPQRGLLEHDISTEVFGRAYLEVRAGYFTHSKPAGITHQTPKRKEEVENKSMERGRGIVFRNSRISLSAGRLSPLYRA